MFMRELARYDDTFKVVLDSLPYHNLKGQEEHQS